MSGKRPAPDAVAAFSVPCPPRRPSAYNMYMKNSRAALKAEQPQLTPTEMFTELAARWGKLGDDGKAEHAAASEAEHALQLAAWAAQAPARDAQRVVACRALAVPEATTWEALEALVAKHKKAAKKARQEQKAAAAKAAAASSAADEFAEAAAQAVSVGSAECSWQSCWQTHQRRKAVRNGLDRVYNLSLEAANFTLFGNDMIQCFHDVANITDDPIRSLALKYVEYSSNTWKERETKRVDRWHAGHVPTPVQIIDTIIGLYCLERVGIHSTLKTELAAVMSTPAVAAYTVVDFLGWSPADGEPPERCEDTYSGDVVTKYRTVSNSLIHSFYAERVGVDLKCAYADVFKHVRKFQPYQTEARLGFEAYEAQCYLVTHIVLTLSNWGELRLEPELCVHEFCFLRGNLAAQLARADVHLVGEFVECMRVFGVGEEDALMRQGMTFLMEAQSDEGLWDEKADPYTAYHATMCAVQALVTHKFRGHGPGMTSVTHLLKAWHGAECAGGTEGTGAAAKAALKAARAAEREKPEAARKRRVAREKELVGVDDGAEARRAPLRERPQFASGRPDERWAVLRRVVGSVRPTGPDPYAVREAAREATEEQAEKAAAAAAAAATAAAAAAETKKSVPEVEPAAAAAAAAVSPAPAGGGGGGLAALVTALDAAAQAGRWAAVADTIDTLAAMAVTADSLSATGAGLSMAKLRKADDPAVKAKAKALVKQWKAALS